MAGHPILSVGDIARETGLSRQRVWQLAIASRIPAKQANPRGKQHRFYDSATFAAWRKKKARQSARPRASQVRRAYRISHRRQEKIEKLFKILNNQTEVTAEEKEAALSYYDCLVTLANAMSTLYMLGWWVRPWKIKLTQWRIPLLEGIHALFEDFLVFGYGDPDALVDLESAIKRLPTRSETTPQTEQSSLNVSA
jgi:hypothetical protein